MRKATLALLGYAILQASVAFADEQLQTSPAVTSESKDQQRFLNVGDVQLGVVLGANPNPPEARAIALMAERIKERSAISLAGPDAKPAFRLIVGTKASNDRIAAFAEANPEVASLGADGYLINVSPVNGEIHAVGESDSGVVAGIGRLMREMRYRSGSIEIPVLRIAESPQMPNRGMYLWARKYYFNEPDKVDRYIEEFALWGGNAICFWFEMGMFNSFNDAAPQDPNSGYFNQMNSIPPQEWLKMYRRFYETARRMGMKTGLLMVANDAYRTSPADWRVKPIIGTPDCYLCPSKPGAVGKMLEWQEQVFKALAPLDIFNIFPADPGGCSCADCQPWPTRGFWKVAQPLAERIHAISPKTEIWIDTWHLNHPTFGGKDWQNLVTSLDSSKERPEWFSGFEIGLAPKHPYVAMSGVERKYYNDARRPLMVFPDISMWGNHPGMLVNKDYWKTMQTEMNELTPDLLRGGWPYAERWNTDIASVMFLSWFWNSGKSVDSVLDEYTVAYFGTEAATTRELLELLDDACNVPDRKERIRATLAKLETTLPEWAKRDWRWAEIVTAAKLRSQVIR